MKKILILLLLSLILVLSACGGDTGNVYSHLQEQNLIVDNYDSNKSGKDTVIEGGVFENLQYNFNEKELERLCSGNYTEEEISFYEAEQYAISEEDMSICNKLPGDPLIFTCDGVETIYYSKNRCIAYFSR